MTDDIQRTVAAMDTRYQAAVKHNDATTIDEILHPDFVLVLGDGRLETRDEQLALARSGRITFEQQDEEPGSQVVRVYGETVAIVTAKLWLKGVKDWLPFDRHVWFSDTYVKTDAGWKYAFGQASLPLPPAR